MFLPPLKLINYHKSLQQEFEAHTLSQGMNKIYQEIMKEKPDFQVIIKLINQENINTCDDFKMFTRIDKLPDKNIASFLKYYRRPLLLNNLQEIQYSKYGIKNKEQKHFSYFPAMLENISRLRSLPPQSGQLSNCLAKM